MVFVNESEVIGLTLRGITENVTGDLFITLFVVFVLFIAVALLFKMGVMEITICVTGLLLTLMAYFSEWYAVGGLALILLAIFFARNWLVPSN